MGIEDPVSKLLANVGKCFRYGLNWGRNWTFFILVNMVNVENKVNMVNNGFD